MTLPVTGQISVSQINTELGVAVNYAASFSWINSLVKAAQRPATPNLNSYHGKTYYQRSVDGNCTSNCPSDCNCGGIDSGTNCIAAGNVNCANCDAQRWLQTNCNCACTYNCTYSTYTYDCNCACAC